jgi:hypothetical protein
MRSSEGGQGNHNVDTVLFILIQMCSICFRAFMSLDGCRIYNYCVAQ